MPKRRLIIVLSLILILWITYRIFAVYTVRSGVPTAFGTANRVTELQTPRIFRLSAKVSF